MKRIEWAILCGFILSVLFGMFSVSAAELDNELDVIRNKVLRLHILANSDSEEDQNLKIKVRDAILKESNGLFTDSTKKDAVSLCKKNIEHLKTIAEKEIAENGFDYGVSVYLDNRYFDTRQYENILMPCGFYDAFVIEIGNANGHNWWCVMFPPLCVPGCNNTESYNEKELESIMNEDEADVLTDRKYRFRFKSVELFNEIKNKLSQVFD